MQPKLSDCRVCRR